LEIFAFEHAGYWLLFQEGHRC